MVLRRRVSEQRPALTAAGPVPATGNQFHARLLGRPAPQFPSLLPCEEQFGGPFDQLRGPARGHALADGSLHHRVDSHGPVAVRRVVVEQAPPVQQRERLGGTPVRLRALGRACGPLLVELFTSY